MSHLDLSALEVNLVEMRCPACHQCQYIATRQLRLQPVLTGCSHCRTSLVCRLTIQEKPNNVLLSLVLSVVPDLDAVSPSTD